MTARPGLMSCTMQVSLLASDRGNDVYEKLKAFRDECLLPSFDAWTNMPLLRIEGVCINCDVLLLLVEVLNLPFAKGPADVGRNDQGFRWIHVRMHRVEFARPIPYHIRKHDYCSLSDIQGFLSAIADRTVSLEITQSPVIVSCFLSTPRVEHVSGVKLTIAESESLDRHKYARLGNMIVRSVQLKELDLTLPFTFGAHELFEHLGHAIHIEALSLDRKDSQSSRHTDTRIGIDPWIRVLHHPHNRLKKLILCTLGLEEQHRIAIAQLLPTSQLVDFKFAEHEVKAGGILEFAHQLSRMRTLKNVEIGKLNGLSEMERSTISAALLQGIMENTSMYTFRVSCHASLVIPLFQYYLVLNRAGRRITTSSQPIPDGLWPFVLERVWKVITGITTSSTTCFRRRYDFAWSEIGSGMTERTSAYDAIYFFLQNCPRVRNSHPSAESTKKSC